MKEHHYRIAGFGLAVHAPEGCDMDILLPSFHAFRQAEDSCRRLLDCTVELSTSLPQAEPDGTLLEESANDMGHIRLYARPDGYRVTLSQRRDGSLHGMTADKGFSRLQISLCPEDKEAGQALSSLLRIAYSQAILRHGAVSVHASSVCDGERAYLFLGKSGTGKSTHSALWIRHIPGTELLNDDNPTVRILCGKAYAWGTPWSGKTPCYKDQFAPVGGMVRLRQASGNRFSPQEGTDAFAALLPGCSAIRQDAALSNPLYDTLARLAETVPVAILDCRPDKEAALVCRAALSAY